MTPGATLVEELRPATGGETEAHREKGRVPCSFPEFSPGELVYPIFLSLPSLGVRGRVLERGCWSDAGEPRGPAPPRPRRRALSPCGSSVASGPGPRALRGSRCAQHSGGRTMTNRTDGRGRGRAEGGDAALRSPASRGTSASLLSVTCS